MTEKYVQAQAQELSRAQEVTQDAVRTLHQQHNQDLLDLADSWESFASTCLELAAFGSCWHGLVFTLEEQEGRGVIE